MQDYPTSRGKQPPMPREKAVVMFCILLLIKFDKLINPRITDHI